MKIIVTGCKGMLGSAIFSRLSKDFDLRCFSHKELDIASKTAFESIADIPDAIINCAAYTNVDLAETEKEKCFKVNVKGVKNLVEFCEQHNILLIHFSTDYVFSGDKPSYDESDQKEPVNYYGLTKSKSEDLITEGLDRFYIIRTSWLFGSNGKNFVDTITDLALKKDKLDVVSDQVGKPTYTHDLADQVGYILNNIKVFKYGIYHITNQGSCSWFEFAKEIVALGNIRVKVDPCSSDKFPRPAKRPRFSVLQNTKVPELRSWKLALKEYLEG